MENFYKDHKWILGYIVYPYFRLTNLRMPWSDLKHNYSYYGWASKSYTDFLFKSSDIFYNDEFEYEFNPIEIFKGLNDYFQKEKLYKEQRKSLGCDQTEMWSLDYSVSKYIVPRLRLFKEFTEQNKMHAEAPYEFTEEQWIDVLNKMLYSFEQKISTEDDYSRLFDKYYGPFPDFEWEDLPDGTSQLKNNLKVLSAKEQKNFEKDKALIKKNINEGLNLFVKYFDQLWD